jgi:hypothetical protein
MLTATRAESNPVYGARVVTTSIPFDPFGIGQDSVRPVPLLFRLPPLAVAVVGQHAAVLPVNRHPGGRVVDGEVRVAGEGVALEPGWLLVVAAIDTLTAQFVGDDHGGRVTGPVVPVHFADVRGVLSVKGPSFSTNTPSDPSASNSCRQCSGAVALPTNKCPAPASFAFWRRS